MTARTELPRETAQRLDPVARSFIEVQFPVSKLSKESYKERKAVAGQTLTALGKWWGRKPLVLVRAIILGLLLPATEDPAGDRETFLALMTMDDDGLFQRLDGALPVRAVYDLCSPREQTQYFASDAGKPKWSNSTSVSDRRYLQRRSFRRMSYDRQLEYCKRPEEIVGPNQAAWARINARLGTTAADLVELVRQLGERRFGRVPRVGDCFAGGGSIPFEAARIGCAANASDLNPVAALLTWGALNVVGGGDEAVSRVRAAQDRVFAAVKEQVDAWGIERNAAGWIADAYLYCVEAVDPSTGWRVPLAPSWVIAPKTNAIARLVPDRERRRFEIEVAEGVSADELAAAAREGTWGDGVRCPVDRDGRWLPPAARQATSIEQVRGRAGLRLWDNADLAPRPADVLQERLYCIRWYDPATGKRHYRAPDDADLAREATVLALLRERFAAWQAAGYIPNRRIESGIETDRLFRERGWTYWHHLFNPRQLLLHGLFAARLATEQGLEARALLLMLGRLANWNSKLAGWKSGAASGAQTYYNQALNTLYNYSCRPMATLESAFRLTIASAPVHGDSRVALADAREVQDESDIWITDPGYADAINYEEVSEFFLAWYDQPLIRLFPGWYSDSKRALAVKGEGEEFRVALAECYQRLATKMSENGFQVVMFTHQDPAVWGDIALVLWAAGLQVRAAWTIATETGATGLKAGNYVQGTVVLVLRKRQGDRRGDMSDLYPEIQTAVRQQLESMLALDPKEDPNFGDTDYQLAAYAAALRVMTGYSAIDEIDVEQELRRTRTKREKSPVTGLIDRAVRIASDILVPSGLDASVWRRLVPAERLYVKGLQVEARGESREGVYQELARGYGAGDYRGMLASHAANRARLKTPSEFAARDLRGVAGDGFAGSLLRQVLFAIYTAATTPEGGPRMAREYLRRELPDYWTSRETTVALLRFLTITPIGLAHWDADTKAAQLLLGSIENDSM